jgi:AcrR family transcriptional regulator
MCHRYTSGMGRWQPDARGRLGQAAMELYLERGYDQTTVADIAQRAGLTSRTFFRHFTDKREVLFAGTDGVRDLLLAALDATPVGTSPLGAVKTALDSAAGLIGEDHVHARQRWKVISTHAELRERELVKLAGWARALADGLRGRGVDESAAHLAAEVGIAVFRVAFELWTSGPGDRSLIDVAHALFDELPAVAVTA